MAYEDEVRPAPRTAPYVEPVRSDMSSYALPIIAILVVLGFGIWFVTSRDSTPTAPSSTIERTAPAPAAPAVPSPAPSIPAPAPSTTPK